MHTGNVRSCRVGRTRGVPVAHAVFRFDVVHDGRVLVEAAVRDELLPRAMESPCLFSIEGKYEAGPCFGHGGACSLIASGSVANGSDDETAFDRRSRRTAAIRRCIASAAQHPFPVGVPEFSDEFCPGDAS